MSRWWPQVLVSLLCCCLAFAAFGPSPLLSAVLLILAAILAVSAFKSMKGRVAVGWKVAILSAVGLMVAWVAVLLMFFAMAADIG